MYPASQKDKKGKAYRNQNRAAKVRILHYLLIWFLHTRYHQESLHNFFNIDSNVYFFVDIYLPVMVVITRFTIILTELKLRSQFLFGQIAFNLQFASYQYSHIEVSFSTYRSQYLIML